MAGFERNENTLYSVPLRFAEVKLRSCPLCGQEQPKWLVKEEWKLLGKQYHLSLIHISGSRRRTVRSYGSF